MAVAEEVQLISYVITFVASFFHFVPVSLTQEYFGGRCFLYTKGEWIFNATARKLFFLTSRIIFSHFFPTILSPWLTVSIAPQMNIPG